RLPNKRSSFGLYSPMPCQSLQRRADPSICRQFPTVRALSLLSVLETREAHPPESRWQPSETDNRFRSYYLSRRDLDLCPSGGAADGKSSSVRSALDSDAIEQAGEKTAIADPWQMKEDAARGEVVPEIW